MIGPRRLSRLPPGATPLPYTLFDLTPLGPVVGAEVEGVDLARTTSEVRSELHRALLEWKVLFFRDQEITPEQHLALARCWGEPRFLHFLPEASQEGMTRLSRDADQAGYENIWHTDQSFLADVPLGAILRAVEVPDTGGDTLFADMACAYDNLEDEVKARIDDLSAVHTWVKVWAPTITDQERLEELGRLMPPVRHPVVRAHPETGRRTLFVNEPYTDRVVGLDRADSDDLLSHLFAQVKVPEYQVRFAWRPGSVAFWDNRAVQHYAVSDYHPRRRVMERVSVSGCGPPS